MWEASGMEFEVPLISGTTITFECDDTLASRWVCESILKGETYPHLPFVDGINTVWDAGANCGATTVHLAHLYPQAMIHAFEPGARQRAILERNVVGLDNVEVHPIGLFDRDTTATLYAGNEDTVTASIHRRDVNTDASEEIELRAAGPWAAEHEIGTIDLMKLDVEGCEAEVLESMTSFLPGLKVLYVEYDSREARRRIDDLLRDSHELFFAMMMTLDQGDAIYLSKELADHPDAKPFLLALFKGGASHAT